MAVRRVGGERQRNIVKIMEGLSGRYSRWEIWQDFIVMSAISIANAIKGPYWKERETIYLERAGKYTSNELNAFSEMLAEAIADMERDPDQDFLGKLFMELDLGNEWKGQFFTPYCVCKAMASITYGEAISQQTLANGWISVSDPACGAGATLIAFANECTRRHINYQRSVLFVAQDIDFLAGCMCYIQLSLMGCPGYVVIDNTLTRPSTCYDGRGLIPKGGPNVWYTPMYFSDIWQGRKLWAQIDLLARPTHAASFAASPKGTDSHRGKSAPLKNAAEIELSATKTGQLTFF